MKTLITCCFLATLMACGNDTNTHATTTESHGEETKKEAMQENRETRKENESMEDMRKDMNFAVKAADAGMMEVALGELAQKKGSHADVKAMGKMMVTDHTAANTELKALAAKKNIAIPTEMSKDAQDKYDDLNKKSGKDFDEAYSKAMVKDHEDAIDLFQKEADNGEDAEVKSWAASKLSTLQHHKQMADAACEKLKK